MPDERPSPVAARIDVVPRRVAADLPDTSRADNPDQPAPSRDGVYDSPDRSKDWAVIAATYASRQSAARRAESLRSKWRDCGCSVFPENGESSKYFVVVGKGLDRNDADRLRDNATLAGLPADTYVTKLSKPDSAE